MNLDLDSPAQSHKSGWTFHWEGTPTAANLASVTEQVYTEAFSQASRKGHLYLIRAWHQIPDINAFESELENYQAFCQGRKLAFQKQKLAERSFPAASAVGSSDGTLRFRFLFSRVPPLLLTNPLQVEAFRYPAEYGPIPPSFARGCVHQNKFFLSGTASIQGHKTLHPGDLQGQLQVTLANVGIMLEEASRALSRKVSPRELAWTVYLRDDSHREILERELRERLGSRILFQEADICRQDLLLEIEGETHEV